MIRRTGFPLPFQIALWATANSAAGAAAGIAVGVFREGGFEPTIVTVSVLFGNVVGFTVLLSSVALAPRLRGVGPGIRGGLMGLALVSGAVAGTAVVLYLYPLYVLRDVRQALAVGAINSALALVVGGVVHLYEGLRWRLAETLREVEEVRLAEARLREQAARAELMALQARMNPHFFFNTLNTISSLLEEDPRGAEEIVQTLAGLFRYTFRAAEAGPVPLSAEIDFVQSYLAIERARFGDRLRVVREIDARALAAPVPALILQPLVENAIGHGIAPLERGGTVRIAARVEGGALLIEVGDDGVGLGPGAADPIRDGHGLGIVRQRLRTLYGAAGAVELHPAPGGRGAVARLRLPLPDSAPREAGGRAAAGGGGSGGDPS